MRIMYVPCSDIDTGRRRAIDRIRTEWLPDASDFEIVNAVSDLYRETLFDESPTIIQIIDKDTLNAMLNALDSDADTIGECLAIITTVPGNVKPAKDIQKKIKTLGGIVMTDRTEKINDVLNTMKLSEPVKRELLSYAGDDAESIVSIARDVSRMPERVQAAMTWDEIKSRLTTSPGEIPPWGFGFGRNAEPGLDDCIADNNGNAMMMKMLRVLDGGMNPLAVTSWLKNNFIELLALQTMTADGLTGSETAKTLGLPDPKYSGKGMKDPETGKSGYPTVKKINRAKQLGRKRITEILEAINKAEAEMKGASVKCKLSPRNIMIRMIAEICD